MSTTCRFSLTKRGYSLFKAAAFLLGSLLYSNLYADDTESMESPTPIDSVKIIIDVSGSMKQNDPNNLRIPATKLLINLLPSEAQAGIVTFATYVNDLMPYGKIDDRWKKQADMQTKDIHSKGMFTDIDQALVKMTMEWSAPNPAERRSVILLTDGMVDVSKNADESTASRKKILDETLPNLKNAGVKIHTVALSDNADKELMEKLSLTTDGLFIKIMDAKDLQRAFLKLFEKAVKRDTLPLEENKFTVDTSVNELTILVFRETNSDPTTLRLPGGVTYTRDTLPGNAKWVSEAGYDLITITKPVTGRWKINAQEDPDNRVMIVSDLKLRTSEAPTNIFVGESFDFLVSLTEDGKVINKPEFLRFVSVEIKQRRPGGERESFTLEDHGLANDKVGGDGIYSTRFGRTLKETGTHQLKTYVDGSTFLREQRNTVKVWEKAADISKEIKTDTDMPHALVVYNLAVDWLKQDTVKIVAEIQTPTGMTDIVNVPFNPLGGWTLDVENMEWDRNYTVKTQLAAESISGRRVTVYLPLIDLVAPKPEMAQPVPEPMPEEPMPEPELEPEIMEPEGPHWVMIASSLIGVNFVFIIIGGIVLFIRKRRKNPADAIADSLDADDEEETGSEQDNTESTEESPESEENTESEDSTEDNPEKPD